MKRLFTLRRGERGASLILVAMALIPLLIVVSLVVDIGNQRQLEAAAQGAVDAAALASTYTVRNLAPGDLVRATAVAKAKVKQGFDIDPTGWATCKDPDHLANIPAGETGTCISFEQRANLSGQMVWYSKIKLPEVRYGTFFARTFGEDRINVESFGGADGGGGSTPPTYATTTTTTTPEQKCADFRDAAFWNQAYAIAEQTIAAYQAANPGATILALWWDGTPMTSAQPPTSPTFVWPPECDNLPHDPADTAWRWTNVYPQTYYWACIDVYWKIYSDSTLIPAGVCKVPNVVPGGYVPPTPSDPTTTTSGNITLG